MLTFMAFLRNAAFVVATLGFVAGTPLTAHAIEVECELRDGSTCTVSNDPDDSVSCMCSDDGAGSGSIGGDSWADFDEEQLMEVCLAEVAFCDAVDTDGGTTGMTTTTSPTTTGSDTAAGGTGSTGGGESTGDPESTGGTATAGDTAGGSGPSTNPSDTDSNGTASGGDSGPAGTTGSDSDSGAESGDGSSGGAEADEENQDPSGCSVNGRGRSPGALLALFGVALGLRSRRRR